MIRYIFFLTAILVLALSGCKTSEANYRAAYEKAKNKGQSEAVDPSVYEKIAQEEAPATLVFGDITFPGRDMYLTTVAENNVPTGKIEKFSVVTGRFKQTFNARMMAKRLEDNGFEQPFVARDRENYYYVVAGSYDTAGDAAATLGRLLGLQVGAVHPFPYVIVHP